MNDDPNPQEPEERYAEMLRLVNEWSRIPVVDPRSLDEILYDEKGVPR